ncbi:TolC family protein [Patiriisocius hiemis]|uniref:TolC family protein n=1 Tax=Patiriisocius hiemis TaxID=3075604 RepID=A0ABU2YCD6_9FLAO|nr:TolC family protein [Constantimarinum sp. W242]MDT0555314.1 TolC family protein [Constantimarinum sp. W242]
MTKKLILIVLLISTSIGFAQEEKQYNFTLQEAITFAIDSNYTAINARRDIAKAIKQKWETTATGLPQISAVVDYQNQLKQPVIFIPAELSGGQPGTFTTATFGGAQTASATATLNQLIFDGSYLVGLQAAKAFLDFSENASEKTNLEVRKGVINAYGSVLLAEELVSIFEKNKKALEENLFETRKIFENGLTEEESVEQLEITLLDIETQLSNAKRSRVIAKQMFNIALGIQVDTEVTLTEDLDDLAQQNIQLAMLDNTLDIEENVDYKIAYNLTEQRELELKLEKSKALPRLTGFINYATQANDNDFVFLDSETPWFQSSIVGLSLNVPIFSSGMRNAKTQQAKIALDQSKTSLEETIQNVNLELNTAKSNYQFAIENYENSKKNLALAKRIENKNQVKFTEGLSTSFDLRQAQTQLYTAQQQYFNSMLNVITSKAEIETILNTLPTN